MNLRAKNQNKSIIFDPTITTKNDLTECFCIFTDPTRTSKTPAQHQVTPGTKIRHPTMKVHTDGACINNGKQNAQSGSGIWFGPNNPRNNAIRIPGSAQSNQAGKIVAVISALTLTPNFYPLEVISDSKYTIEGLTTHLKHWEDIGWIQIKNAELFQRAAYLLRQRTTKTTFKWVKGHQGNLGNKESNKLAKEGANKDQPDQLNLHVPDKFFMQGAKLSALKQATAYQRIRKAKAASDPPIAAKQTNQIRAAIENYSGECETNETI